ncbi:hypothetical protein GJ496_003778 [Pomphorhynchus laevis]|nr:hypothetical protein GJ496_003778 [Pomphorhynchus laevis]
MRDYRLEGNTAFANNDFTSAINLYTLALQQNDDDCFLNTVKCLNNRAICHFKLDQFSECLKDACKALELNPNNLKSKYRKAQSLKALGQFRESYDILKDILRTSDVARNDSSICELYKEITGVIQKQIDEQNSTDSKARLSLEKFADDDLDVKIKASRNLIILSDDNPGCSALIKADALRSLKSYIDTSTASKEIVLNCYRVLANFAKCPKCICQRILTVFPVVAICEKISTSSDFEITAAISRFLDNLIYSYTELEEKRKIKKPINVSFEFDKETISFIDSFFRSSGALIETSCAWSSRFIPYGIPKVLRISASVEGYPKCLSLTEQTKQHASCLLSAVYDDLCSDVDRGEYRKTCEDFVRNLQESNEDYDKIRAVACVVVILQGPFDVGNSIIGALSILNDILKLATSGDEYQEKLSLDAILLSSSKTDKAMGLLSQGHNILKKLFLSPNENIQIRALLGLCKLSASKGSDFTKKTLSPKRMEKLESTCVRLLLANKDSTTELHASDGLAFLSLDADVKERLVNNKNALNKLFSLVKKDPLPSTCFTVCSIIFNLSNAEVIKKPDEEMIKLAKYSKQHIPEVHPKDLKEYVDARRKKLMEINVASVLVLIAKEKSDACRTMISKICLVLAEDVENRGSLIAAGIGKVLIPLSSNSSGSIHACQALSRIAISCNPEIAFPGQRCMEIVKPLVQLLHPERSALENFEALLAFTNLATVSTSVRNKIICDAFSSIEQYQFEEHPFLRRAATEVICNLCVDEQVNLSIFRKNLTSFVYPQTIKSEPF